MRKKTNLTPELLNEELKKFKLLSEYDFYDDSKKPVILNGELDEAEEEDVATDELAADLGVDTSSDEAPVEEPVDASVEEPVADEPAEAPVEEPVEDTSDDVEIDVTSLVQGSEEAKMAAEKATQNTEMLLQKLSDLESRIASMDAVSAKISELEKEMVKRNPTPNEKLELQVTHSGPYTQRLEDYWADKEGVYDVNNNKKDEYTLTQDDVDTSYSEPEIKKSFGVSPNDFEEEDI